MDRDTQQWLVVIAGVNLSLTVIGFFALRMFDLYLGYQML